MDDMNPFRVVQAYAGGTARAAAVALLEAR